MKYPVTSAVRFLRSKNIDIVPHLFDYIEKGGTSHSSVSLGVDESSIIKTLIFETSEEKPFVILMHGHMMVSTKRLARALSVKSVAPVTPNKANRLSGYMVGGTSPFGLKTPMPIYIEESVFKLDKIFINGGKRGFLVELDPETLKETLSLELVSVGIKRVAG